MDVPWFAGEDGTLFVFRVNRRPLSRPSLFTPEIPDDIWDHFLRMLAPGYEITTGRRNQRVWRVGGVHREAEDRTVVGKLGWQPTGDEIVPEWSRESMDWLASTASPHGGRVVPFGFDAETRLLTVLRDPKSPPQTVATVFERILRDNEAESAEPSTEWSVEPVLDAADFLSWLADQDVVTKVSFTARLPNPEARDAFRNLAERMQARRATRYSETLSSEQEAGLVGVEEDTDFRQAIAMGEQGFATLRGQGVANGSESTYSQTNRVAREHVDQLPDDWEGTWELIKRALKNQLRRFLDDGGS